RNFNALVFPRNRSQWFISVQGVADGMLYGLLGGASPAYLAPKIKQLVADFAGEWLSDVPAALRDLNPEAFSSLWPKIGRAPRSLNRANL
ncbi:hypothetical protein, partial [Salmonella enterica]|uniref:hypothetical protein n=1 Tax=Salmonella enterica TaxID=28901 RepID=UPI0020C2DA6E